MSTTSFVIGFLLSPEFLALFGTFLLSIEILGKNRVQKINAWFRTQRGRIEVRSTADIEKNIIPLVILFTIGLVIYVKSAPFIVPHTWFFGVYGILAPFVLLPMSASYAYKMLKPSGVSSWILCIIVTLLILFFFPTLSVMWVFIIGINTFLLLFKKNSSKFIFGIIGFVLVLISTIWGYCIRIS